MAGTGNLTTAQQARLDELRGMKASQWPPGLENWVSSRPGPRGADAEAIAGWLLSRNLSRAQLAMLAALRTAGGPATVLILAPLTGQSPDGAAYTLRSLTRRGLARCPSHDGERWTYALTSLGLEVAPDGADRPGA
jgi:hypothetical protein